MKLVAPLDATWLYVEARDAPMHVGCLQIFAPGAGSSPQFLDETIAAFRATRELRPLFRMKLQAGPLDRLVKRWTEDDAPDLHYHVVELALPRRGTMTQLTHLVAHLQETELDLTRPLWRCYFIRGLQRGRFALFTKIHHSLIDGIGGVRLLQSALTHDRNARDLPAPFAAGAREHAAASVHPHSDDHHPATDGLRHALELAAEQFRSAPGLVRAFGTFVKIARHRLTSELAVPYRAPQTLFNRHVSPHRSYATQRLPLKVLQRIAHDHQVTVNDVFLCLCAGALRRYLEDARALPAAALVAGIPVSVRPAGDDSVGTAVTFILASLHTEIADPLDRLHAIHRATRAAKEHLQTLRRAALTDYTLLLMGPYIAEVLTGFGGYGHPVFNLAISNVPGPQKPLYFNGVRLEALYPTSVLTHGQALNITVLSYAGWMNIGYTACARAVRDAGRLATYTLDALEGLQALSGSTPRRVRSRKPTAGRSAGASSRGRHSKSGDTAR